MPRVTVRNLLDAWRPWERLCGANRLVYVGTDAVIGPAKEAYGLRRALGVSVLWYEWEVLLPYHVQHRSSSRVLLVGQAGLFDVGDFYQLQLVLPRSVRR